MRTKHITMRQSSGFQYSLSASILDTPKGQIRTLSIVDHEVCMRDKEPSDTFTLTFNSNSFDTNTEQLKELCEFILKEIKKDKKR